MIGSRSLYLYTLIRTLILFYFIFSNNRLFNKVDKNNNGSVSATELRVLFLGLRSDNDLSTDKDVEDIMESFDMTGDASINLDEFVTKMTKLVNDLSNTTRGPKLQNAVTSNTKVKSLFKKKNGYTLLVSPSNDLLISKCRTPVMQSRVCCLIIQPRAQPRLQIRAQSLVMFG